MAKVVPKGQVCATCGADFPTSVEECPSCGRTRIAPHWIRARIPINRNVNVDLTTTSPEFGKVSERITLSKWWPGGKDKFNIKDQEQWVRIRAAVDALGTRMGWKTASPSREKAAGSQPVVTGEVDQALIRHVLRNANLEVLDPSDYAAFSELVAELLKVFTSADRALIQSFRELIPKLPSQGPQAVEELAKLLQSWSLLQINSVTMTVKSRLETIELLKQQVLDPSTYEIIGKNSIHRILERAMWLVDERYWLMSSNETLRTLIGEEWAKRNRAQASLRPDFVCGDAEGRLIILELKRPSKDLEIADLNQLETYVSIARHQSTNVRSFEAYLVGKAKSADLEDKLEFRVNSFKVLTYADLLGRAEKRYRKFLTSLDTA